MPIDTPYTIAHLARITGVNGRTIRYYISQGLLPASGESGPGAHYGQGHLDRLQLIKRLQTQYLPNAEIRRQLSALSDDEVAGILAEQPGVDRSKPTTSALDYVRGVLGESAKVPAPPQMLARSMAAPPQEPQRSSPTPAVGSIVQLPMAPQPMDSNADADVGDHEPPPLERSQWERLSLSPDVELHVRRPLSRQEQKRVDRLITIARQVLKEGRS